MSSTTFEATERLIVVGGTHGWKEPVGIEVVEYLRRYRWADLTAEPEPYMMHPRLLEYRDTKPRMLGDKGQIMRHFPGNPHGNPEEQAAAAFMEWLGDSANNPDALVVDIHCNPVRGLEFAQVGRVASVAALAAAFYLEHKHVVVAPGSDRFFRAVPNAVLSELYLGGSGRKEVGEATDALKRIALRGIGFLEDYYDYTQEPITYWQSHSVLLADPESGRANEPVLAVLDELEAIEPQPPFTPLELSPALRRAVGVGGGVLAIGTWHYNNLSPEMPEYGATETGQTRHLVFGGLFERIAPPVVFDDRWVRFEQAVG